MMRNFDETTIGALRDALPDYLRNVHGVEDLRRNFRCIHPDHEDRDPSMTYLPADAAHSARVYCHGCHASGDVFDVAGWDTGATSFTDKVLAAAEGAGLRIEVARGRAFGWDDAIDVPDEPKLAALPRQAPKGPRPPEPPRMPDLPNLFDGVADANTRLFYSPDAADARAYLDARGFDVEDLVWHLWGWVRHPSDLIPGNDGAARTTGGYITIPHLNDPATDAVGDVRYATFRAVGEGAGKVKEWKPAGQPAHLYGEHWLGVGGEVIVTEGAFDAVAIEDVLAMGGRDVRAVGLNGCGTGRLHAVLWHTDPADRARVVLALDNDEAGRQATEKALAALDGVTPCRALGLVPKGFKDANDWLRSLRKGAE